MSFLDFRRPHVLDLLLLGCTVCDMFRTCTVHVQSMHFLKPQGEGVNLVVFTPC